MPQNSARIDVIRTWLDAALQQIAAESYWHLLGQGATPQQVLERGNSPVDPAYPARPPDQFVRLTSWQATAFAQRYQIVDHHANDASGFSATLLLDTTTGQHTLAFRSTEYKNANEGGDFERDAASGAGGEISSRGFALGQLAAAEAYYSELKLRGVLGSAPINLVGYSLGGHLALVFTELHAGEIAKTYVFNAAGRGSIALAPGQSAFNRGSEAANIGEMLRYYRQVLDNPDTAAADVLRNSTYALARQLFLRDGSKHGLFAVQSPLNIYLDARHAWALTAVTGRYALQGVPFFSSDPSGSSSYSQPSKVTQLFGHAHNADREQVANSGIHPEATPVYIEGQPFLEGSGSIDILQIFAQGRFGNTHSLTLIIDSLAVMSAFMEAAPAMTKRDVESVFGAASFRRAPNVGLNVPSLQNAEGDSLEVALDALRKVYDAKGLNGVRFSDPTWRTRVDFSNGGFGNVANREQLHEHLRLLQAEIAVKGSIVLRPLVPNSVFDETFGDPNGSLSANAIAASLASEAGAPSGIAHRYALRELNPFVALNADSLYEPHNQNGELDLFNAATGNGDITDEYVQDRARLLSRVLAVNVANLTGEHLTGSALPKEYFAFFSTDQTGREVKRQLTVGPETNMPAGRKNHLPDRPRILFGSDNLAQSDSLIGYAQDDRIFGGKGNDKLVGNSGNDYLQGDAGEDRLSGGENDDRLLGGKEDDQLDGGAGTDTYIWRKGDGFDTITDAREGPGNLKLGDIVFLGESLAGVKTQKSPDNPGLFEDAARQILFAYTGTPGVDGILYVVKQGEEGGLKILDFRSGDFGIGIGPITPVPTTDKVGTAKSDNTASTQPEHEGTLSADAPNQKVFGLGGNDRIVVATAGAQAYGGDGRDYISNEGGDQKLFGEAGDDILIASGGNDCLDGGTGNDALQGGADSDVLEGGEGDDFLDGGTGSDAISGGEGNDFILGGGNMVPVLGEGELDDPAGRPFGVLLSDGVASFQNMAGVLLAEGDGANSIDAGAGDDTVLGGEAEDYIEGGADDDLLAGMVGEDWVLGGGGADVILGDSTQGMLTIGGQVVYTFPQFHASDYLDGGAGADMLVGDGGADEIYGGTEDDLLIGDASGLAEEFHGADYLDGGDGADRLFGYGRDDTLFGGAGNDVLEGDSKDVPFAKHGADYLDGEAGDDILVGNGGADTLFGGEDKDQLFGDTDDTPVADQGDDYLDGEGGDDYLRAYGGDDTLFGGDGADQLLGEAGQDYLEGGTGDDALAGGPGKDTYFFSRGDGRDAIEDAPSGANDPEASVLALGDGISRADVTFKQGSLVVDLGGGDEIHFAGFDADNPELTPVLAAIEFADGEVMSFQDILAQGFDETGTEGDDLIFGSALTDRIEALGGNDEVLGLGGDDAIGGGAGNDTLQGNEGDDSLQGADGNDELDGGGGADRLEGGAGDDALAGNAGDDLYVFGSGDGADGISEAGGADAIRFGESLARAEVAIERTVGGDLLLTYTGGTLSVAGHYLDPGKAVESVQFADGTSIGAAELAAIPVTPVVGSEGPDVLTGGLGEDRLLGLGGEDRLDGGAGDDRLEGGGGEDHYLLAWGGGRDRAADDGGVVELGAGLRAAGLRATAQGADLLLSVRGAGGDALLIEDYASNAAGWSVREGGGATVTLESLVQAQAAQDALSAAREEFRFGFEAGILAKHLVPGHLYQAAGPGVLVAPWQSSASVSGRISESTTTTTTTSILFNGSESRNVSSVTFGPDFSRIGPALVDRTLTLRTARTEGDGADLASAFAPTEQSSTSVSVLAEIQWGAVKRSESRSTAFDTVPIVDSLNGQRIGTQQTITTRRSTEDSASGTVAALYAPGALPVDPGDFPVVVSTTLGEVRITETVEEIVGGASANRIRYGEGRYLIDAGAGDDEVSLVGLSSAGTFIYGNAGADKLSGAAGADLLAGGEGNDTLDGKSGADRVLVLDEAGFDVIDDTGNTVLPGDRELTTHSRYAQWYYTNLGIEDWESRMAGFGAALPPLPRIPANDYAGLAPLYAAGLVETDAVEFAAGISLSDLSFSWGTWRRPAPAGIPLPGGGGGGFGTPLPGGGGLPPAPAGGTLYTTLDLFWGADRGVRVVIPRSESPADFNTSINPGAPVSYVGGSIGTGIEEFRFADGTTLSMAQMIGLAAPAPSFDPDTEGLTLIGTSANDTLSGGTGNDTFVIGAAGGVDTISDPGGDDTVSFGAGIGAEMLSLGVGSLLIRIGPDGDALHIAGFDPLDPLGSRVIERFSFAGGTQLSYAELLARGFDHFGTTGDDALTGTSLNDRYRFDAPGGADRVSDPAGLDRVILGAGHSPDAVAVRRTAGGFALDFGAAGSVAIEGIEEVEFAGGPLWDTAILDARVNDAPVLQSPIADLAATEDMAFSFALPADQFSDADAEFGDVLAYSVDGMPAWLAFDPASRTFSGTPLNGDVGTRGLRVTATDREGAGASDEFMLTVSNVNDAPLVAQPLADRSFAAGAQFAFAVPAGTFADEDAGDAMTLSASLYSGAALPAWLTFDPATGTFAGAPQAANVGITHVAVTATDAAGAAASSDFGLIVRTADGATHTGSAGDDVIYGGDGNETLIAKGGSDYVFGDAGNDLLRGGAGNDVLQGGAGDDVLRAGTGSNLLEGGAGNDLIYGGQGSGFIAGGLGDDVIRTGRGRDVIGFNRGDGADTVYSDREGDNTLSLGGGIRYEDLRFRKSGKDLVLETGGSDSITFKHWYSGQGRTSLLNIQIVTDAMEGFDESSTEPLSASRVNTFDAAGLVAAFDAARASDPYLTSWALSEALAQFHRWGNDDAAIGGDMAYWYGRNRGLGGLSLQSAQQVIGAAGFGSDAQTLRPFSGLQEGLVKLA